MRPVSNNSGENQMIRVQHIRLTAAAAMAAAALAVGCGGNQDTASPTAQTQLAPVMTTIDDDRVVASVRSHYFTADQIKAQNIDVSSDQGVVTLKGRVASDDVWQRAVSIAKDVQGVMRVDDQLQVASGI